MNDKIVAYSVSIIKPFGLPKYEKKTLCLKCLLDMYSEDKDRIHYISTVFVDPHIHCDGCKTHFVTIKNLSE